MRLCWIPKNTKVQPKSSNTLDSQNLGETKAFFLLSPFRKFVFPLTRANGKQIPGTKSMWCELFFFQLPNYPLLLSRSRLGYNEAEHYHNGGKIHGKQHIEAALVRLKIRNWMCEFFPSCIYFIPSAAHEVFLLTKFPISSYIFIDHFSYWWLKQKESLSLSPYFIIGIIIES